MHHLPFNRIQIAPTIVSTNRIQRTLQYRNAQPMPMGCHRPERTPNHRIQIQAIHLREQINIEKSINHASFLERKQRTTTDGSRIGNLPVIPQTDVNHFVVGLLTRGDCHQRMTIRVQKILLKKHKTYRIQRLQAITTAHYNQFVFDNGDAKLQPPAGHVLEHCPPVQPWTVALDANGTLVCVQTADGQQLAHGRFTRSRSLIGHLGSSFGQQVPLERLHNELLAAEGVALRFNVVGNKLRKRKCEY